MNQIQKEHKVTVKEQIKKFAIKSMYGFQTVLVFGIGRKLGIFDYLHEKGRSSKSEEKISTITFTLEEISDNLKLSPKYLEGWLHMALECGIFELDDSCERCLKTAPHVYDLLIDRDNMFYLGNTIACFYLMTLYQDLFVENFKTGKIENILETPPEDYKDAQTLSARWGLLIERLFSKHMRDFKRRLQKQGLFLEVGCGYGLNLEIWAKKYKRARFVGIDIDPNGISDAKKLIQKNNWDDRVEFIEISVSEYAKANRNKFDIILLNHVLHEMNPDENYRRQVIEDIYTMLKDDGLFIVGESMIPDLFAPKKEFQLFDIMHKWIEVPFGSRFYNEESFKELINSTSFKNAELIREKAEYFWAVTK